MRAVVRAVRAVCAVLVVWSVGGVELAHNPVARVIATTAHTHTPRTSHAAKLVYATFGSPYPPPVTVSRQWRRKVTLSIVDCVFVGNSAGAMGPSGSHSGVTVSTDGLGGAMFLGSVGDVLVQGTRFIDNGAATGGGGTCPNQTTPLRSRQR